MFRLRQNIQYPPDSGCVNPAVGARPVELNFSNNQMTV